MTGIKYVLGQPWKERETGSPPVLVVATPTAEGWRTHSTRRGAFQHDYVSDESWLDVLEWLQCELSRTYVTASRDEVVQVLSTPSSDGTLPTGFLHPPPPHTAEQVLRHLEAGW